VRTKFDIYVLLNLNYENVDIKFGAHDACLEWPSIW
jgi:hypothetical protein